MFERSNSRWGATVSARCRVVVIGAGYAGVMAANRLAGAYGLRESADVNRLRAAFRAGSAATVIVIGAGLTGIEVSAEIAEKYPQLHVRLISRGGNWPQQGRKAAPACQAETASLTK